MLGDLYPVQNKFMQTLKEMPLLRKYHHEFTMNGILTLRDLKTDIDNKSKLRKILNITE